MQRYTFFPANERRRRFGHGEAARFIPHRQRPFVAGISGDLIKASERFRERLAAFRGGGEENVALIKTDRGTHGAGLVCCTYAFVADLTVPIDVLGGVLRVAGREEPPGVRLIGSVRSIGDPGAPAGRRIRGIRRDTGGVRIKSEVPVRSVRVGDQEYPVRTTLYIFLGDRPDLGVGERSVNEVVARVVALQSVIDRRVPVQPRAQRAGVPRIVGIFRVVDHIPVEIPVGKQDHIILVPRCVGFQKTPLDGLNFKSARTVAALFVAADVYHGLLPAYEVRRIVVFHKLQRFGRLDRQSHVRKGAGVVRIVIAVILLAEYLQGVGPAGKRGQVDRDLAFCGFGLRDPAVVQGVPVRIRQDRGDIFVFADRRAAVMQLYRSAGNVAQGRSPHGERSFLHGKLAGSVEQRQLPRAVGAVSDRGKRPAALLAALGGGDEKNGVQIHVQSRTDRDTSGVNAEHHVTHRAPNRDKICKTIVGAECADPISVFFTGIHPRRIVAPASGTVCGDRRDTRRILGVGIARKTVRRVRQFIDREREHLVRRVTGRTVVSVLQLRLGDCRFFARAERAADKAVVGIGFAVAVQPRTQGAGLPRDVFVRLMIIYMVKVLIREQEQLPVRVREHAPFDGIDVVAGLLAAALQIFAEPDGSVLSVGDLHFAVLHKLQRLNRRFLCMRLRQRRRQQRRDRQAGKHQAERQKNGKCFFHCGFLRFKIWFIIYFRVICLGNIPSMPVIVL